MVFRIKGQYDLSAIDDLEVFNEQVEEINIEILDEVRDEIAPHAIDELSLEPPPTKKPIQWTSDRQRKAFFASNGFGKGIPYKRTGGLAKMWVVEVRGNTIVIENKSAIGKYVYGSLAQNRSQALRFQQQFHANTGWQPATDTAKFWLDAADELYYKKLDERLGDLANAKTSRRAFTKGTRRR